MPLGPGKYDEVCTLARELTGAQACIVIIFGGVRGEGFAVQSMAHLPPKTLATMLRHIADEMERSAD